MSAILPNVNILNSSFSNTLILVLLIDSSLRILGYRRSLEVSYEFLKFLVFGTFFFGGWRGGGLEGKREGEGGHIWPKKLKMALISKIRSNLS